MVLRKLSQTLRITLALMVATFSSGLLQPAVAYATQPEGNGPGNNGTLKIHEADDPSGTESNNPKVCSFNVEGFNFDEGQTGFLVFETQGNDSPAGTPAGPFDFGPADVSGFYATEYFDLDDGHYKATVYGKDTGGAINLDDEKAKSKVFKVECASEVVPTGNLDVTVDCEEITLSSSMITPTDGSVTYTIDSELASEGINSVSAGSYTVQLLVNGEIVATTEEVVVEDCATETPTPLAPTASGAAQLCKEDDTTQDVIVTITNTADDTNSAVSYEITIGTTVLSTGLVADGSTGSVTFTGLAAGSYTANIGGSDETTATSNSVTVAECGGRGGEDTNQGLCHATGSGKYVLIDDISSAGIFNGHYEGGTDEVSNGNHQNGEDIIPPFTYQDETYSQNFDTEGQAIFNAGCETPTIPTDVCPNIEGDQTTAPAGTVIDANGNCVTPVPAVCTVSNNNYIAPWMFDGDTYPYADEGGTFEFKADGLYLNTPTVDAYVYGFMDAGNTKLSDVDAMSYETLRLAQSAGFEQTLPAYILYVDTNGTATAGGEKYMFYEPYYNGSVTEGTWQTWDAYDGGDAKWYISGTGQTLRTWDYFVADLPDAVVIAYGFNQGTSNAETFSAVQDIAFDCATTHFGTPGQGGGGTPTPTPGQVQGTSTTTPTTPQTLGAAVLPAVLPSTGGVDSPFMILVASLLAFGATYFLQGKRLLGRREAVQA